MGKTPQSALNLIYYLYKMKTIDKNLTKIHNFALGIENNLLKQYKDLLKTPIAKDLIKQNRQIDIEIIQSYNYFSLNIKPDLNKLNDFKKVKIIINKGSYIEEDNLKFKYFDIEYDAIYVSYSNKIIFTKSINNIFNKLNKRQQKTNY